MSLQLLTTNRKEVSTESWLHFDSKNQEFIGVPLAEEVGREEYQLVSAYNLIIRNIVKDVYVCTMNLLLNYLIFRFVLTRAVSASSMGLRWWF